MDSDLPLTARPAVEYLREKHGIDIEPKRIWDKVRSWGIEPEGKSRTLYISRKDLARFAAIYKPRGRGGRRHGKSNKPSNQIVVDKATVKPGKVEANRATLSAMANNCESYTFVSRTGAKVDRRRGDE